MAAASEAVQSIGAAAVAQQSTNDDMDTSTPSTSTETADVASSSGTQSDLLGAVSAGVLSVVAVQARAIAQEEHRQVRCYAICMY